MEAGAAISGAALDATWGKGAAKAAKAAKGKKAKHAERGGRHPDSGNPAQAYARSAGRYADNIPRGGVSHDFADAYRYRQTGGKSAMQLYKEAEALADAHYERIRNSKDDVAKIAANTGLKPHNIQKVKDHVFYNEHILDKYTAPNEVPEIKRFDSDLDQAQAWKRLEEGNYTPEDITWMKHEMAERWHEQKHGSTYKESHEAAEKKWTGYPWRESK